MDQPSFRSGNLVQDLRLEFKAGVVTDIQASLGEEFVRKQLKVDSNADKVGEFSLTDKRFSRIDKFMAHTLYDENFGGAHGNCHIALGASYAETYAQGAGSLSTGLKEELGFNDSALHWDLVNIEPKKVTARLTSGGERLIYQDGCFAL
jgi:aminopeptidase